MSRLTPGRKRPRDPKPPIHATDEWFLRNGLPYFVPEVRRAVREGLKPKRLLVLALLIAIPGGTIAVGSAWLTRQAALAPAAVVTIGALLVVYYALTTLHARPIARWAGSRALHGLRNFLPTVTRGLPLLLLFVTFLFINAEVWEVAGNLSTGQLWLTAVLLAAFALLFLLVHLPEEVDRTDDAVDDRFLRKACRGTPMQLTCDHLIEARDQAGAPDPNRYATVSGFERVNLILTLMIIQAVQVFFLVAAVFVFLMLFGALTIGPEIQEGWVQESSRGLPVLSGFTVSLAQVSFFLASFSGLYFTVSSVTDDTYRGRFFTELIGELEQAVGVRAVYLAARDTASTT